jgi:hypothetical protein
VASFDELLAELLEEPPEVLGYLSDIVTRGRMQAEDMPTEPVEILARFDLVAFLVQRQPRRPVRTWVYPSPLGLKVFAVLEREAERQEEERVKPTVRTRGRRRDPSGVTR